MRNVSAFRGLVLAGTALTLVSTTIATPAVAATCTFTGGTGNWGAGTSWNCDVSGVTIPSSADNVLIDGGNVASSVVSVTDTRQVNNVTLDNGDTLSISNASLSTYGNSFANSGTVAIGSNGQLIAASGTLSLTGAGTVVLGDVGAGGAYLYANGGQSITIGAGQVVSGTGYIANDSGAFVNNGTINANTANGYPLYLDAQGGRDGIGGIGFGANGNAAFVNTGLIEATNGGSLVIRQGYYENQGNAALVADGAGSTITLNNEVRISGGTLTTTNGGAINAVNNGTQYLSNVSVTNGSTLTVASDYVVLENGLTNNGTIAIGANGYVIGSTNIAIGGTGTITLNDVGSGGSYLYGNNGTTMTLGAGQRVTGTGYVNNDSGFFVNNGVITATAGSIGLNLDAQGGRDGINGAVPFTNNNLLQATGGGNLVFRQGEYDNTNGAILATGTGSTVTLNNDVRIIGGTITSTNGGAINAVSNGTQYLNGVNLTGGTTLNVANDTVTLENGLTNNGAIAIGSNGNVIGSTNVAIGGTGTITLSDVTNGGAYLYGNNGTTMTIGAGQIVSGTGYVGNDSGFFINNGTITATAGSVGLNLDAQGGRDGLNGAVPFTNNNLLQATGGGNLVFRQGEYDNTNGAILATGTGSTVTLNGDVRIIGGTITGTNGGVINAIATGTQYLSGVTLTSGTALTIRNDQIQLEGSLVNNGTITIGNGSSGSLVSTTPTASLSGVGAIRLLDTGDGQPILSAADGSTLTIGSGQTISGTGYIGNDSGTFINDGVINANLVSTHPLFVDAKGGRDGINGAASFTNNNLIEATAGGTLVIRQGEYDNSGGSILASGSGSTINMENDVRIVGGTLSTANGGMINAVGNGTQYLNNVTLTGGSTMTISNDVVYLENSLINNGTIALSNGGTLYGSTVTSSLTGTGSVTLDGALLYNANGTTMTIGASQTVSGNGTIGNDSGFLTNAGVINANTAGILYLDAQGGRDGINGAGPVVNTNLIEATSGGRLVFRQGEYDNSGGTILASGANSSINMENDVRIVGGALSTSNGGVINAVGNGTQYLNNVTLTDGSAMTISNDVVYLENSLTNNGTITLSNGGVLYGSTTTSTLGGTGDIAISGSTIYNANGTTMTIGAGQFIHGSGAIGNDSGAIINDGNILANGSITIDAQGGSGGIGGGVGTTGTAAFFNGASGQVQANNGGSTLTLAQGAYENAGSFSVGTNSNFVMADSSNLQNLQTGGTLSGGGYFAFAGGTMTLRSNQTSAITTIGSDTGPSTGVFLSGAGSTIQVSASSGGPVTTIDQSLQTIAATGSLSVTDGRSFTAAGAISNAGTLRLDNNGSFTAPGGLTNSGTITGNGTIGTPVTNSGIVVADRGTLASQAITGTGTVQSNAGATLDLSGATGASTAGTLVNNGSLALGANNITVSTDYRNPAFVTASGGFDAHANVSGTGMILATSATQDLSGAGLSGSTLNVGNVRLGGSASTTLTITNNGTETTLRGAVVAGPGSTITITNGSFVLAANGGTQNVTFGYTGNTAGSLAGQTVTVANNFDNVVDQTLTLQGAAYRVAQASLSPNPVDLGVSRVGGTLAGTVTITNTATADGYSESLAVTGASGTGGATGTAPSGLVAAGGSTSSSVALGTATSGIKSGSVTYQLATDGTGTSGLAQESIDSQTETVQGIVTQTAVAQIIDLSNIGTLSGSGTSYTLDLGTLSGSGSLAIDLGVLNAIANTSYGETLGGLLSEMGSSTGYTFSSAAFAGLTGGSTDSGNLLTFSYTGLGAGTYTDTLTFNGYSHYAGLSDLSLMPITISVRANVQAVTPPPSNVPEPTTWWMMVLGFGLIGGGVRRSARERRAATLAAGH